MIPSQLLRPVQRFSAIVVQGEFRGATGRGVPAPGLSAAFLTRRSHNPPDPTRRSRGHLCLDVLRQPSVADAVACVRRESGTRYNPFNLLIVSAEAAAVVS